MDDLLAKNLANIFLPESSIVIEQSEQNKEIISIHSFKLLKDSIFIRTINDTFSSKIYGTWKNKPVIIYNESKYVLLETSKTIVSLDYYGVSDESIEKFEYIEETVSDNAYKLTDDINNYINIAESENLINNNLFDAVKNIIQKQKETINISEDVNIVNITEQEDNITDNLIKNIADLLKNNVNTSVVSKNNFKDKKKEQSSKFLKDFKDTLKKKEVDVPKIEQPLESSIVPIEPEIPTISPEVEKISNYMPIEPMEASNVSKEDTDTKKMEELFFQFLETNKTDKRFTKFLNNHLDIAKKEIFAITEKFTKEQMLRASESGGGSNAMQFANGGTMNGSLSVIGDLTVSGQINGQTSGGGSSGGSGTKSIHLIGDGINTSYTLSHNLNTKDLVIQAYDSNDELIFCSIKNQDVNTTIVSFQSPIASNAVKVIIVAYTSKKVFIVGDNSNTEFILTHNLNTKDLLIQAYDNNTDDVVVAGFKNISLTETKVIFGSVMVTNSVRVVISG